jgi:regulator of nucleoside diphosphate kinase
MKPPIIVSTRDFDRIDALLASLPKGSFPGQASLETELDRAKLVAPEEVPPTVVTMNSTIRFRNASKDEFCMTLVYPRDMNDKGGTISILAPVGSALLGLSQGDEIEWPKPGGGMLKVSIVEVTYQPERAGEYHR